MESVETYWDKRRGDVLYAVVDRLVKKTVGNAKSVLDVGSGGCPHLEVFEAAERRVSVDLRSPYEAAGVEAVTMDFLDWEADQKYDVVLCLQSVDRFRNPRKAAEKLLKTGRTVIVSVTYGRVIERGAGKPSETVDEETLYQWFRRQPNFTYFCKEVVSGDLRLICVFDATPQPWASTNERRAIRQAAQAAKA